MITLVTYNIRGTKGMDDQRSVQRVANVISRSGAEIVCLQEVDQWLSRSDKVDQPAELARLLGMRVAFQRNLKMGAGWFGNAVLTSMELAGSRSHSLTSEGEQRGALEARIVTPTGPITVFCTHWGLSRQERIVQARELAALVNATAGPRLVCGDFNEEADDAAVAELIQLAHLIDAAPGGEPTFDSNRPSERIDMILHDQSITIHSVTVPNTQASDHLPLVASLAIDSQA